ncbi:MAG TPA: MBL fold metallo-hydrolase [Xanthomonadaceae bacterium]|nr:MBL fold metallo-hydrolase [Xanthomonadaceae bacterium]
MNLPGMTIVFDNDPGLPGFPTLWGFAAVIQTPARIVLFDTGSNGRALLKNMAALQLPPAAVDLLFLSHPHWDHIGGLDSFLEVNPRATVVVHDGFSKHLIQDLRALCGEVRVVGPEPQPLAPGIFSTGVFDSEPPEQALILDIDGLTAAISGCAHPGMERIVERAKTFLGKPVEWAIGGFHLMYADAAAIARAMASLQHLGVEYVVPTHCTGDEAREAFRRAYGERCLLGGVGRRIEFGQWQNSRGAHDAP